jgi:hypothetical protein
MVLERVLVADHHAWSLSPEWARDMEVEVRPPLPVVLETAAVEVRTSARTYQIV